MLNRKRRVAGSIHRGGDVSSRHLDRIRKREKIPRRRIRRSVRQIWKNSKTFGLERRTQRQNLTDFLEGENLTRAPENGNLQREKTLNHLQGDGLLGEEKVRSKHLDIFGGVAVWHRTSNELGE